MNSNHFLLPLLICSLFAHALYCSQREQTAHRQIPDEQIKKLFKEMSHLFTDLKYTPSYGKIAGNLLLLLAVNMSSIVCDKPDVRSSMQIGLNLFVTFGSAKLAYDYIKQWENRAILKTRLNKCADTLISLSNRPQNQTHLAFVHWKIGALKNRHSDAECQTYFKSIESRLNPVRELTVTIDSRPGND